MADSEGIPVFGAQQVQAGANSWHGDCSDRLDQLWKQTVKKLKLVMIGNGMAGVRTLEELLKVAPELYDITVFGAEPHPNYNRILLSPVLAGEQTLDQIVLNPWDWYTDNQITLHAGKKVASVDRIRRTVLAEEIGRAHV